MGVSDFTRVSVFAHSRGFRGLRRPAVLIALTLPRHYRFASRPPDSIPRPGGWCFWSGPGGVVHLGACSLSMVGVGRVCGKGSELLPSVVRRPSSSGGQRVGRGLGLHGAGERDRWPPPWVEPKLLG